MGPIKVNSISKLDEIPEDTQVTLDGILEKINKAHGLLYISIMGNGDENGTLRCVSYGIALLGKNFNPGDLIYVTGRYLAKSKSLSLEGCGYQTSTKHSELPQ